MVVKQLGCPLPPQWKPSLPKNCSRPTSYGPPPHRVPILCLEGSGGIKGLHLAHSCTKHREGLDILWGKGKWWCWAMAGKSQGSRALPPVVRARFACIASRGYPLAPGLHEAHPLPHNIVARPGHLTALLLRRPGPAGSWSRGARS